MRCPKCGNVFVVSPPGGDPNLPAAKPSESEPGLPARVAPESADLPAPASRRVGIGRAPSERSILAAANRLGKAVGLPASKPQAAPGKKPPPPVPTGSKPKPPPVPPRARAASVTNEAGADLPQVSAGRGAAAKPPTPGGRVVGPPPTIGSQPKLPAAEPKAIPMPTGSEVDRAWEPDDDDDELPIALSRPGSRTTPREPAAVAHDAGSPADLPAVPKAGGALELDLPSPVAPQANLPASRPQPTQDLFGEVELPALGAALPALAAELPASQSDPDPIALAPKALEVPLTRPSGLELDDPHGLELDQTSDEAAPSSDDPFASLDLDAVGAAADAGARAASDAPAGGAAPSHGDGADPFASLGADVDAFMSAPGSAASAEVPRHTSGASALEAAVGPPSQPMAAASPENLAGQEIDSFGASDSFGQIELATGTGSPAEGAGGLGAPAGGLELGSGGGFDHAGGDELQLGTDGFGDVALGVEAGAAGQTSDAAAGVGQADDPGRISLDVPPQSVGGFTPMAAQVATRPRPDANAAAKKKRGPTQWIVAGVVALAIVGAGALELTSLGAFGRHAISDYLNRNRYVQITDAAVADARKAMSQDRYDTHQRAIQNLTNAHLEAPRARPLAGYLAFAELASSSRFGTDPDAVARAKTLLGEIPGDADHDYVRLARSMVAAAGGDVAGARGEIDSIAEHANEMATRVDAALALGEIELRANNNEAALAAFESAAKQGGPDARVIFGRARALARLGHFEKAEAARVSLQAASPQHVGLQLLRAQSEWDASHDGAAALKLLSPIIEGPLQDKASPAERADALSRRGAIFAAGGRSTEARQSFDAALMLDSRNVGALVGHGDLLRHDGRFTEALTRYTSALEADPGAVRALVGAARTQIKLEHVKEAKAMLDEAHKVRPNDARIAYWLGKAEEAAGNKPAAAKHYQAAIEHVNPKHIDAIEPFVALASLYGAQGNADDAARVLEDAKKRLPDSAALRSAIGNLAAAQGRMEEAVAQYEAALERAPDDLAIRFQLGKTLLAMRRFDDAKAHFDFIQKKDREYPGLSLAWGRYYEASGDIDKALDQFKSALAKAPDDVDLQLRIGAAYTAIERPDDAVPILRKVISARPNSAEANHYLGRALFLSGTTHQAEAMRFLKRAIEIDPNRAEFHFAVGWAANNSTPPQFPLAEKSIERALELDALYGDAYWQRGDLARKRGAVDDAVRDFNRALELNPTRVEAYAGLALAHEEKNDLYAALGFWQKALAGGADKPEWNYQYGRLLYNRGSYAEAGKHLIAAADEADKLNVKPGWLPRAVFMAAEVLRRSGRREDAVARYEKFLRIAPKSSPDRRDAEQALERMRGGGAPGIE